MQTLSNERRTRRSHRPDQALVFQLEQVRDEAGLDALVLATAEGLPVAHSGEDELCEEIAALAPFLSGQVDPALDNGTMRVRAVNLEALSLWLVSYRSDAVLVSDGWLERASSGIARILAA
ncbi:MAG: hypothetical protein JWN04_6400 [Myxococcaceae bacterium]|nr:hypothetical protein [Myxococcaceae bacterium]